MSLGDVKHALYYSRYAIRTRRRTGAADLDTAAELPFNDVYIAPLDIYGLARMQASSRLLDRTILRRSLFGDRFSCYEPPRYS